MADKPKPKPHQPNPEPQPTTFWMSVKIPVISTLAASVIMAIVGSVFFYSTDYIGLLADKKIDTKLQSAIEKSDAKLQPITDKLITLGERVAKIEGKLDNLRIQRLAMQPKMGTNGKQVSEILKTAKKDGIRIDPELITVAGKEFISAGVSSSDPGVWNAALAFLDYRSAINSALAPTTDKFTPADKKDRWSAILPANLEKANFFFLHGKAVSAEQAAVFEPIGKRLNVDGRIGSEFILLSGSTGLPEGWKLDGYRLRNVIFKDSEITYEGGPIDMQNVIFANCTFKVSKLPNGKNFASTVLASAPATTFHAGG
jgi:hypothetical protein